MIATDILLVVALTIFLIAWWLRAFPARALVLAVSAAGALAAAIAGVFDFRWQAALGLCAAAIFLVVLGVNRWRGARHSRGVPWFSGAAFTLLASLAAAALWLFPATALPPPQGPHAVGARTFELVDQSRLGVLGAPPQAPRRLLVRVWYPAETDAGFTARPYFTAREAATTARGLGALVGFPPLLTYLKHVRTNSYENAPLLRTRAAPLPAVFYSHGYISFLGQNSALMEHLASHGYVVFSLQHSYDSSPTVFADGEVLPLDPAIIADTAQAPSPAMIDAITGRTLDTRLSGILSLHEQERARGARVFESALAWVADQLFLHDQLQAGAVPAHIAEIAAASDLEHVGQIGMSFGGATAGAVCMIDRRCAAGINLDGADFHFLAFDADAPVPFLMFHSDPRFIYAAVGAEPQEQTRTFNEFSYERFATSSERTDIYRVALRETRHLGLSDFSLFMRRPVRDVILGPAPAQIMIGAQNDFVLAFLDRHLRAERNGFPETPLAAYRDWATRVDTSDIRTWWAEKPEAERAAIEARIAAQRD